MSGSLSGSGAPPPPPGGSGDDDTVPPANLPFKSGDFVTQGFNTADGVLDIGAKAIVNGKDLHLDQIAIFMRDSEVGHLGMRGVLAARKELAQLVKDLGFKRLRISGVRIEGSTFANPGKTPDVIIDLTK